MKNLKRPPVQKSTAKQAPPLARKAAPLKAAAKPVAAKKPLPKSPSGGAAPVNKAATAPKTPAAPKAAPAPKAHAHPENTIAAWENDPESGLKLAHRSAPTLSLGPLPLQIRGEAPKPGVYTPGTENFRYWNASDALRRARELWKPFLPDNLQWHSGTPLEVDIDGTEDLNAYYDRKTLSFFRGTVKGRLIHTADSPDIVAHEFGHAVLDALRPDLWDAALDEVAAFHESFGDITALLSTLQLESVCEHVIKETGGLIYQSSTLSRLAAQFGKAVHDLNSGSAPPDCLRNAVNSFFYREPMHLPPMAPHSELSSEPHSFSRVFTSGFFEAMAGMLKVHSAHPTAADLLQVSKDAAAILAKAVRTAALSAAFYSEVAAQIIWADAALFAGKY
ncbi:MAG TPA: hypothetical protein VK956_11560, partial [Verrucomicrobium sp.]|nr:hypothetical protein [Verrucomicrobium sp.]